MDKITITARIDIGEIKESVTRLQPRELGTAA